MTEQVATSASHELADNDFDVDGDLRRMSLAALSALESLTEEVNEIEKLTGSLDSASKPNVVKEESDDEVAEDSPSELKPDQPRAASPPAEPKPSSNIKHIDDIEISDDEADGASVDGMSMDGLSTDGSLARELNALRSVTKAIEKELAFQDTSTMQKELAEVEHPDDPKKRVLSSDDHEIIQRILDDELKKYEPKNEWERFLRRYHLEGISEDDKTYILVPLFTVVWSIVLRLLYNVTYGEI